MHAHPAPKTPLPPPADASMRPRRRRVSALLAERRIASTHGQSAEPDVARNPRRRTIYVPSDDTTVMTVHPGYPQHPVRPASPNLGLDLVTLSEEDSQALPPAIKQTHPPRKHLAAAPNCRPLQKSSRPLQAVSFAEDVVGKSLGKENIPPGMSLKSTKQPRPATGRPTGVKPESVRKTRLGTAAPPHVSAPRVAVTRKRTGSDTVASPSKAPKTTRTATCPRQPLQVPVNKRQTRSSTSNQPSPFHATRSPPQALRRHRAAKPPSKLAAPRLPQDLQSQDRYPVLYEDLDRPELYEDNWLSYQEVAITQLINKLFDCVHLPSKGRSRGDGVLRKNLLAVYQDPAIPLLHKRLQASLMYGALAIPKHLLAKTLRLEDDVGLRRKYLSLFVDSYEPSILRAAAEVIVGRECRAPAGTSCGASAPGGDQRQIRAEKKAIERFLDTFFIRNEDAVRVETGFGSIASIARGRDKVNDFGSQDWSWRRTTLRSLMLILLLDMAGTKDVVSHPLFQVSSSFKSSHAVLQELAGMLLPSLGDLSRPLGHLNYHLHCFQYPLQEYNYHVGNLATDLRDGVLLTRLVELLLYPQTTTAPHQDVTVTMPTGDILTNRAKVGDKGSWVLSQHLKFPCVSRTQKLYNAQLALSALEGTRGVAGQAFKEVSAEDIVDGHRERTLGLLWSLVGKWGLQALVDWTELEKEMRRYRSRYYSNQSDDDQDPDTEDESELTGAHSLEKYTALLRGWAHRIARCRGLRAANLTTSFADGRVLEAIVDEYVAYFPSPTVDTAPSTKSLPEKLRSVGCSSAFVSLFTSALEKSNRPIPSKDFTLTTLAFLASRLLPASRAHHAASTVQRWFPSHCATVVQTRERVVGAAVVLQRAWRNVLDSRIVKLMDDITAFQALARAWAVRCRMPAANKKKGRATRKVERIRGGW
ncbi:calmodulin-binding protein sha1 [Diplodia corticola]|uniref:Calmodulin-binding protein sha1 n=1 Tax=Diplodia corticola TaxID=236234 RepID=A0A1J9SE18_9PEZI|nr:calmodulin-binding protein sha1 [Diplodia corticola]OJD38068.1 calmodulin-binding protein sha1 [Diplodia corticola]